MTDTAVTGTPGRDSRLTETFIGKYREIFEGSPSGEPTWVTSGGPEGGVYGTLEDVSAEEASRDIAGTSIAAHAEHLRWAIDLVNDYFKGKEPTADWSESWKVKAVDGTEWDRLRAEVKRAGAELLENAGRKDIWTEQFASEGALASYGHAAYHLGALRQMRKAVKA